MLESSRGWEFPWEEFTESFRSPADVTQMESLMAFVKGSCAMFRLVSAVRFLTGLLL